MTSIAGTNLLWSSPSTWIGNSVPATNQDVLIPAGSSVVIDNYFTNTVDDVTINGKLDITSLAASTLSFGGALTVNGILNNNGGIEVNSNNKSFTMGPGSTYTHNPRNNTLLDESIFVKMLENFDPNSNLFVYKWFDLSIPLGSSSRVTSTYFGSVTLGVPTPGSRWNQAGQFMDLVNGTQRVKGTFSVTDGTVVMDDGTGASSSLILNDVIVSNTGNLICQSGQNRPFTLFTNNFTDVSSSANATVLMDSSFSLLIWTVNGNVTLSHSFNALRGSTSESGGDVRITINGGLTINGGSVDFVKMANAPIDLNVIGSTIISGTPAYVSFCDGNSGNVTYRTTNLTISGGNNNILFGGMAGIPQPTGVITLTINNDLLVNGASTTTLLKSDTTAAQNLSLKVGRDLIISGSTNANLTAANSRSASTVNVVRNLTLTSGKFTGQANVNCTSIDSILIGLDYLFNSPTATDYFKGNLGKGNTVFKVTGNYSMLSSGQAAGQGFEGITNGTGNLTFSVGGTFTQSGGRFCGIFNNSTLVPTGSLIFTVTGAHVMNNGFFRGIDNRYKSNGGSITYTVNSLTFNGGNYNAYQTVNFANSTGTFNIAGNCNITYATVNDSVLFIGQSVIFPDNNAQVLSLNIGGNLSFGGANGTFISSIGNAPEIINITGDINYSNGRNSFNSYPNSVLANAHKVNATINGNINVSGGTNYLSAFNDSMTTNVNGNLVISNGTLSVQAGNTYGRLFVKGGFNMSGGTFYLHNNTNNVSFNSIEVTINSDSNATGDFIQSGGTINFDNNVNGPAFTMWVKSPNVTYSGGGMTRANPGTNTVWGNLVYRYPGTVNFNRSGTHNIQQVRQKIDGTTYFNMASGYIQVASYTSGPVFDMLTVTIDATLDMHSLQIKSNVQQPWSGVSIAGRIKTSHPNGLYNGTTNATIDYTGQIYFWLQTNSTVEYNGTDNQIVSGVNLGTATLSISRYYNLDINFQGTPDVEFVYPTNVPDNNSVIVRNKLILTNGELNLDSDHISTNGGGRSIILGKGNFDYLVKVNGYIRSEVSDGTGLVKWAVGATPSPHVIPFAYASGAANYIPFTFERVAGTSADTLMVATYHTNTSNLPYPPTVTHVNSIPGTDNSANTVDRFWYIKTAGNATAANMIFTATAAEIGGIPNLRAQRWIPYANGGAWELPYQGTQTSIVNGTSVSSALQFKKDWWTLAGLATPLPVELSRFEGNCQDNFAQLEWTTQSEVNNSHFTIMRSEDGISYKEIGVQPGAGTVSTATDYSFKDPVRITGIAYYMLRQTDYDGHYEEFGPVAVQACIHKINELKAYSTGSSALAILLNSASEDKYTFRLFDLQGKLIFDVTEPVQEGFNSFIVPLGNIADGIYMLQATGRNDAFTQKVFIQGAH